MSVTMNSRVVDGVTILDLSGRLTLGDATAQFRDRVRGEAEKNPRILLNVAGLSYMDSAGLGEMVGAQASVTARGGQLKLVNAQQKLRDLLQITRLYTIFESFDDEATAVRSFTKAAAGA
jgi:anti-sigma B factor antagonist